MISKRCVMECDWCGDYRFGDNVRDLAKYYWVYKFKQINPTSDELWISKKYERFAPKYLGFCCEECAKAYFEDSPEDVGHYALVKNNGKD